MSLFSSFYLERELQGLKTLSFKFNLGEMNEKEVSRILFGLVKYVESISGDESIAVAVAGRHEQGRNELPHLHLNLIVDGFILNSNESRRRTAFMKGRSESIPKISMREGEVEEEDNALNLITYVYKEGLPLKFPFLTQFDNILSTVFIDIGKAKYEQKLQRELAQKRASDKSENLLNQILGLIPSTVHFTDYGTYKKFIYPKFYEGLEVAEYPQQRSVQQAIQNIAIFKKIVEPWFFDKN